MFSFSKQLQQRLPDLPLDSQTVAWHLTFPKTHFSIYPFIIFNQASQWQTHFRISGDKQTRMLHFQIFCKMIITYLSSANICGDKSSGGLRLMAMNCLPPLKRICWDKKKASSWHVPFWILNFPQAKLVRKKVYWRSETVSVSVWSVRILGIGDHPPRTNPHLSSHWSY